MVLNIPLVFQYRRCCSYWTATHKSKLTFLVGAFLVKRARLLQWLVFFRQTTDLMVCVPLFSTDFTRSTVNPAVTGSSPCFSQTLFRAFAKAERLKGPLFQFFSPLCDFSIFFCLQRVPPSSFFDIFQQTKVPKSPKGPSFKYFGTTRLFKILIFRFFFKNFLKIGNFLSPKAPYYFLIFCNKPDFKKARRVPLLQF